MHASHKLLLLLLTCLAPAAVRGQKVPFVSGEEYQIRCLELPGAAVSPSSREAGALACVATDAPDSWWRITQEEPHKFLLRNAATRRYLTYDGVRTSWRRYLRLSQSDYGDLSRWNIYRGRTGLAISNSGRPAHYLNVRRHSYIVGSYQERSSLLTDNERFFLVNRKGQVVNVLGKDQLELPDQCYSNRKKGLAAKMGAPPLVASTTPSGGAAMPRPYAKAGVLDLVVNDVSPVREAGSDKYLFTVPRGKLGGRLEVKLAAAGAPEGKLYVDGKPLKDSGKHTFTDAGGGRTYSISLTDASGSTVAKARLQFTALPIVEITGTGFSRTSFRPGTFCLHDPDRPADAATLSAKFRHRGDYTAMFSKKNFGVKLLDATGHKLDRTLLGLRSDNYWILDAMVVDHARMRNRVGMDLWNDMATPPYYAASGRSVRTGVRGRLVEVFVNGAYQGVYNLCERTDRKQLQLAAGKKGEVRGCLYKSANWDTWTLLGASRSSGNPSGQQPPRYDNNSTRWGDWEAKCLPSGGTVKTDWRPLYDACALVSAGSDEQFCREVGRVFDLPAVADYYLFIELLHAVDNSGKNMYWAVHDVVKSPKLTPAPWDLDGTFGRNWAGHRSSCDANNDYRRYLQSNGTQNALFERLQKLNPDDWNKRLARRYRELRRTHFRPEALYGRFEAYFSLLKESGADQREAKRWRTSSNGALDFATEMTYLKRWIEARVACLDRQYGYR